MAETDDKVGEMNPSLARVTSRRSSLFEMPYLRPKPAGSSVTAFAEEPTASHDGMSFLALAKQNKVQYENSYHMEPPRRFQADPINTMLHEMLVEALQSEVYEPITCSTLCKSLTQEIKTKVKALNYQRYKFVCTVNIGEKKDQGVRCGSRCIWDTDRDTFAQASYQNAHLYATAMVYACYFE